VTLVITGNGDRTNLCVRCYLVPADQPMPVRKGKR
jgi:hypothetical protein